MDRVLRIMERRARLLGLDAPVKAEHKVSTSFQPSEKPMTAEEAQDYLDRVLGSRHTTH